MQKQLEIYVDGSYLKGQVGGGWAAFINDDCIDCVNKKLYDELENESNEKIGGLNLVCQTFFTYDDWSGSRNVAGEAEAMIDALKWYIKTFCKYCGTDYHCKIFYDYNGLQCWLDGSWKSESRIARWYKLNADDVLSDCETEIEFVKIDGHSGNVWHDYVDKEARETLRRWQAGEI